jgi:uncharacterized repeat protein (TIGR01451 family)
VTATATLQSGVLLSKQASGNSASSGDLVTYTLTLTITGNPVSGMVLQDTLPADVTFVDFLNAPPSTTTSQAGNVLTWNLPTLSLGPYQITYQVRVNDFLPGGEVFTNSVVLTAPGLASQTAQASVAVVGHVVKIGVYNEVGELVKQIAVTEFSRAVENLQLSPDGSISGLVDPVEMVFQGVTIASWDGTNGSGSLVGNGTYYVKVDNIDSLGTVTTVTREITVSRSLAKIMVSVYNEAGEVVRRLYGMADDSKGTVMSDVDLNTTVIVPGAAAGNNPTQLEIVLENSGVPVTLTWDGTGDSGAVVAGGHYELHVQWDNGQGTVTDITRGVMVAGEKIPLGQVTAAPNVLNASNGMTTAFMVNAAPPLTLRVRVYTIAGELAAGPQAGGSGGNSVTWDASGMASGMYLAVVEGLNTQGGTALKQIVKVLVVK